MKQLNSIPILLTLLFCSVATRISAQQTFPQASHHTSGIPRFMLDSLVIVNGSYDVPCPLLETWVMDGGLPLSEHFSPGLGGAFTMQRGNGMKNVNVKVYYRSQVFLQNDDLNYAWRTDGGSFNETGSITLDLHQPMGQAGPYYGFMDDLTISYSAGDTTDNALFHVFSIWPGIAGTGPTEIRFKAVLVGASIPQPLGYFDTPALPLYILHDPPGDRSWAEISDQTSACVGHAMSINTTNTQSGSVAVKLGLQTTVGWIVTTQIDVSAAAGIQVNTSQNAKTDMSLKTCLASSSTFRTSNTGTPQDIFIGRAMRYLYGVGCLVTRPTCDTVVFDTAFVSVPDHVLSTYMYTEQVIRNTVIPNLQDTLITLAQTVGTEDTLYQRKSRALTAWQNTLAMNDSIKQEAPMPDSFAFMGGSGEHEQTRITDSTAVRSMQFTTSLSTGLSASLGASIGGNGVTAGGEVTFTSQFSATHTDGYSFSNAIKMHFQDDDLITSGSGTYQDEFNVRIGMDRSFGTFVFKLDSLGSHTSCPYEGGYQVDQPSLSVGTPGNQTMTVDTVFPAPASFPLWICNNSMYTREYVLALDQTSLPPAGVTVEVAGQSLLTNLPYTLDPGQCVNPILTVESGTPSLLTVDGVRLFLSAECNIVFNDTISASAHFALPTGITAISPTNGSFTVRPNPSAGRFDLVNAGTGTGPVTVTVHDGLGRTVLPTVSFTGQPIMPIDLEGVAPGAYYLTATSADQQQVLRVMVQQ